MGVYIGSLWIMVHWSSLPGGGANIVAYSLATLLNYFLNFYWSFGSKQTHGLASTKFLTLVLVGLISNSVFVSTLTQLGGVSLLLAATLFSVIWPLVSFSAQKIWVFRV